MYSKLPHFVLGFHGCTQNTFDEVIKNNGCLSASYNDYDWLGEGVYFWENNLERAWQWANDEVIRKKLKDKPAVIGAVIDLGKCLNMLDNRYINIVKDQYEYFKIQMELIGAPMPKNLNIGGNNDLLLRKLDCAVINSLHRDMQLSKQKTFDSVRGMFIEGNTIYENSGFREKAHIQLAIRNPNCIKGYFAVQAPNDEYLMP